MRQILATPAACAALFARVTPASRRAPAAPAPRAGLGLGLRRPPAGGPVPAPAGQRGTIASLLPASLLVAAVLAVGVPAQGQGFRVADVVTAELRPGWRTETGTHMAALHIRLAEGWKTYWRAPGDAGIPPRFDWSGSHNLTGVSAHWPRPEVFELAGMRTLGFATEMVLPLEFTLQDAAGPTEVRATVEMGVCETVCVPVTLELQAVLPVDGAADARIAAALADRPVPAAAAGLRQAACSVAPVADGVRLTARLDLPRLGDNEMAVFELSDEAIWISEVATHREAGGTLVATADLVSIAGGPVAFDRSDLRVTVLGDSRAVELQGCPGP